MLQDMEHKKFCNARGYPIVAILFPSLSLADMYCILMRAISCQLS